MVSRVRWARTPVSSDPELQRWRIVFVGVDVRPRRICSSSLGRLVPFPCKTTHCGLVTTFIGHSLMACWKDSSDLKTRSASCFS